MYIDYQEIIRYPFSTLLMCRFPEIRTASIRSVCCLIAAAFFSIAAAGVPHNCVAQQSNAERASALAKTSMELLEGGSTEEAYRVADQAMRLSRNSYNVLVAMGRVMLELPSRKGRALQHLERAVALEPENTEARYYTALAHIHFSQTDILRSSARKALRELDKIIATDPSHFDAHYQRGLVLRDSYKDFDAAREAFQHQIDATPNHVDARFALLEIDMGMGNWDSAIEAAESALSKDPNRWEIYPYLAGAHWKAGRFAEAMEVFERYFTVAPERELNLYMNLGLILTPSEKMEFSGLDDEGRQTYWGYYWRTRDPDQKTEVNERLLEHFIRIAYARLEFSKSNWPWDTRGDLFVRYGEPDIRTGPGRPYAMDLIDDDWDFYEKKKNLYLELGLSPPTYWPDSFGGGDPGEAMGRVDGGGTVERWIYTDRGLDFTFDNPVMSGRYLRTDATSIIADAMEVHMPSLSLEEEKIETFDPLQSAVTFRGADGKTRLEYSIGILPDDFGMFRSPTGAYSYINLQMELFSPDWRPIADAVDRVSNLPTTPQVTIRGNPLFVHATQLEVEPGEYILATLLVDPETRRQATSYEPVVLPDYSGSHLMLSEIMLAARITPITPGRRGRFIKGSLEVLPLPGRTLGASQPLFVYFEIYNLSKNAVGATEYTVKYAVAEASDNNALLSRLYQGLRSLVGWGERRTEISSEITGSGIQRDVFTYLEIDMSRSKPGVYELLVAVTDLVGGSTTLSTVIFRTLPILR